MSDITTLMTLIPGLPLLASLVTAALGKTVLKERSHIPTVAALVASFVFSLSLLFAVGAERDEPSGYDRVGVEKMHTLWTWASLDRAYAGPPSVTGPNGEAGFGDFRVDITLRADPLTAIMLSMVTFISSLVAIYAIGYMHGDPGYWRFFTYVSLFVFSMTMLVSVSNFVLLYVFWEAVGVCSYLLIGFWFEKPEAAAAGKKAFLVNRIGDFGFALGVFLIWTTYGTLNFHDLAPDGGLAAPDGPVAVAGVLGQARLKSPDTYVGGAVGLAICLCLLTGACGKSAQFPLHVWLPDAMEGPTPVSALIHAATMVTAGVYLIARCTPLFVVSSEAQAAVAVIGGFTALLAGVIAITQTDLKRVLAYSTVSQLGYMFLGLGAGTLAGVTAGMFHLFTHAFFKALLFLGAGSVMHAMGHVIDMRRFSGLRHIMPWTFGTFWCGALALAGVVPLAGFWSKDAILSAIHDRAGAVETFAGAGQLYECLYFAALFTAFLTAFYTFRALFLTFYGPLRVPPEAGDHAHESPPAMTAPLVALAVCVVAVGACALVWISFHLPHGFAEFLAQTPSLAYSGLGHSPHGEHFHLDVAALSTVVALAGIGLAAFLYLGDLSQVEWLTRWARSPFGFRLYQLSNGKFFFDQIYRVALVWPMRLLANLAYWLDRWLVDGAVNLSGRLPVALGSLLRALQNGMLQFYALAMMLGLLVLIGTLLLWPGS